MSRYFKQLRPHHGDARRALRERRQREEMGDEAYEKQLSYADDQGFKIFAIAFIVGLAALIGVFILMGW